MSLSTSAPHSEDSSWPQFVVKRDGTTVPFSVDKLKNVILQSYLSVPPHLPPPAVDMANMLSRILLSVICTHGTNTPAHSVAVETLQDSVELALSTTAPHTVSRHFILYREQRAAKRAANAGYCLDKIPDDIVTPWGPLGYVTFKRTYARPLPHSPEVSESFRQTILRVLDATRSQLKVPFTIQEVCFRSMHTALASRAGLIYCYLRCCLRAVAPGIQRPHAAQGDGRRALPLAARHANCRQHRSYESAELCLRQNRRPRRPLHLGFRRAYARLWRGCIRPETACLQATLRPPPRPRRPPNAFPMHRQTRRRFHCTRQARRLGRTARESTRCLLFHRQRSPLCLFHMLLSSLLPP